MYWDVLLLLLGVTHAQYLSPDKDEQSITSYPYPLPNQPINTDGEEVSGIPRNDDTPVLAIPTGSRINVQDDRLQYTHGFSDADTGTSVSEQGRLLSTNDGWEYVIVKKGSYSYTSPEGIPVSVNYIADHNGFRIINN